MNALEDIWDGRQIHPDINTIYARLKHMTILRKLKVNVKENNSQRRGCAEVYINSLSLL